MVTLHIARRSYGLRQHIPVISNRKQASVLTSGHASAARAEMLQVYTQVYNHTASYVHVNYLQPSRVILVIAVYMYFFGFTAKYAND